MKWKTFVAVILAVLLCGCTTPFRTPVIEEPGQATVARFDGIATLIDKETKTVPRVLWTHGMCTHDDKWVLQRFQGVQKALNATVRVPSETKTERGRDAYMRSFTLETTKGSAHIDFFVWSPLNDAYKRRLDFDRPGQNPSERNPYQRASLNQDLKVGSKPEEGGGLINDCFVDAIVYSGSNGIPVKTAAYGAVCQVLGGKLDEVHRKCTFPSMPSNEPVFFVSESLGSKIIYDAVQTIWDEHKVKTMADSKKVLEARLSAVRTLFMPANQLPLLDQANHAAGAPHASAGGLPSGQSSLEGLARIFGEADAVTRRKLVLPPRTIVAFTDPNDLLSYRLLPQVIDSDIRLVNIIVSNDHTYFGWVERPDTAHCGYGWNSKVLGTILFGYDGAGTLPDAATEANRDCLD